MKKVVLLVLILITMTGVAAAAPLTDYSAGKVSLDLSLRPSPSFSLGVLTADSDGTPSDLGITVGLGSKLAVQYRQFNLETKWGNLNNGSRLYPASQRFKETNLLYQLNKNVSVYAGALQHSYHAYTSSWDAPAETSLHLGFVGVTKLGKNFSAYGNVALGSSRAFKYEVGLSYAVTSALDLNVFYIDQKIKVKDFGGSLNNRVKGLGYGLTFRFN